MSSGRSGRVRQPSSSRITRISRAPVVTVETAISAERLQKPQNKDLETDENHNLTDTMDANDISHASSFDPTSEVSSLSPHPDSADDMTTADDSFAIDYRGGPSEVVVHGTNVNKIRVKFPPQPPKCPDNSARSARRRQRTSLERVKRQSKKEEEEDIPFSKEESLPNAHAQCSQPSAPVSSLLTPMPSYPVLPDVPTIDTNMYTVQTNGSSTGSSLLHSLGDLSNRSDSITLIPLTTTTSTDFEVEKRMKDGIMVGLDYFEKKNKELREIKNRLIHELDRVVKVNSDLQIKIDSISKRLNGERSENDELKVKLDQAEKENARLQDQALSEWTSRVKTEELSAEQNACHQDQMKSLQSQLDTRDSEMRALKSKLDAVVQSSSSDEKDMMLELHTKMASLKEDVRRLTMENENLKDCKNKTTAELENMKRQVTDKNAELERQFNRFLSLKRSFNDVMEENERLKHSNKPTRGKGNTAANVTWPREGEQPGSDVMDGETVRRLDLPPAVGAKTIKTSPVTAGTKALKTAFGGPTARHRRQGSDARSENLPPVSKKDGRRS